MAGASQSGGNAPLTGARKSALLCLALGPKEAANILRRLSAQEVEEISREIASMPEVDPEAMKQVLSEYQNASQMGVRIEHGGMRIAQEFMEEALGKEQAAPLLERIEKQVGDGKLTRLEKMEPEMFASVLLDEHPQTISVILAHLDLRQASKALQQLPSELAADVVYRLARIDKIAPEVLAILDTGLQSKTDLSLSQEMRAPGGPAAVARMLNMTTGGFDDQLLQRIDERNNELAAEIKSLMFVFEDLLLVDNKGIQRILREVDNKDLSLALKGSSPELRKHIMGNMSERAAAALEEEMDLLGAVRVKDVESAHQRILEEVRRLEDEGEIVIRREGGDDEFIA
jgi:flagellar motor switch protein FliG